MILIEEITTPAGLATIAAEWNALLDTGGIDHPFLSHEWITCWWDSFGAGNEMYVLVARRDGAAVGIAPLMKTTEKRRGVTARAVAFMANYHSNRTGFILAGDGREALDALCDHIATRCEDVDLWMLDFIPEGSNGDILLPGVLRARNLPHVIMRSLVSPFITIDRPWDAYWATRKKKFRHGIKQDTGNFLRGGQPDITLYTAENLDEAYAELLQVSRKTWKYQAGTAIASTPENMHFYQCLARIAAARGWLNIWILRREGQPAAFSYCLVYKGRAMVLKIGFDIACAKDGPGGVLSMHTIRHYFSAGLTEYDWLGENEPYKRKWTSLVRAHNKYLIFMRRPRGRLLYLIEQYAVPAVKKAVALFQRAPVEGAED